MLCIIHFHSRHKSATFSRTYDENGRGKEKERDRFIVEWRKSSFLFARKNYSLNHGKCHK